MTFRVGDEIVGLRDTYCDGFRDGRAGFVFINAVVIGSAPPNYKNQGYYVAGSAFEEWVTIGLPSTFPPSAHTLADCQHLVLET